MRRESFRSTKPEGPDWRQGTDGWWYSPLWLEAEQRSPEPGRALQQEEDRRRRRGRIMLLLLLVGVSVAILLTVISNSRTEHHLTGANPADRPRLRELVSEKCGVPVQYLYFVRYVSPSERIPNIDGTLRVGFTVFDNGNPYDAYAIDDTLVTRCDYGD